MVTADREPRVTPDRNTEVLTIAIPPDLKDKATAAAAELHISLASWVRMVLTKALF